MRPGYDGPGTRALILEAILDLPLGASMREVAQRIGKHINTVENHVHRLRKSGQVEVVKRGWKKRKVVVPVRLRVSETEAEWLKLGTLTARAIVIVARSDGQLVSSAQAAKALGWHHAVTRYHLQRARKAGILEAHANSGYRLASGRVAPEYAGLREQAWCAVRYIAQQEGRRVSSGEIMRVLGWTKSCAKYHLHRATRAGLLSIHAQGQASGYALTPNAHAINWSKGDVAAT